MKQPATLRHRVGSLLIVGVEGPSITPLEAAWLSALQPAGVILFRRNIESPAQVHGLFRQIAAALEAPFFRCVDVEGGTVDRLRDLLGPAVSAQEVAATFDPAIFREHGASTGRALRSLGFNVDLAPVLDLALPASVSVMGTRVSSGEPAGVIAYASEFLAGLARYRVLGCGKHFPGLGGGRLDSHRAMPKISRNWDQLWREDLAPYRALASQLPFVMVNHAAYPKIEQPPRPASLSRFWISEVLRDRLGYRGLAISDDMEMGGVLEGASIEEAAVESVAAGMDMLEICHRADRVLGVHEALLREAERSAVFRRRVSVAAARIERAKDRYLSKALLARPISDTTLNKLREDRLRLRERVTGACEGTDPTSQSRDVGHPKRVAGTTARGAE